MASLKFLLSFCCFNVGKMILKSLAPKYDGCFVGSEIMNGQPVVSVVPGVVWMGVRNLEELVGSYCLADVEVGCCL